LAVRALELSATPLFESAVTVVTSNGVLWGTQAGRVLVVLALRGTTNAVPVGALDGAGGVVTRLQLAATHASGGAKAAGAEEGEVLGAGWLLGAVQRVGAAGLVEALERG